MSKTHLKLPVTGILALLMTGCGLMSSSSVAQVHENALVCENCNYVQAQQLAMQHAVPDLQCVIVGGGDVVNIDNQSCTSQPKHIVVFNAQSRQAYPFEVYHAPQGVNPFEMQLHTRDRTVHPEIIAMLNTGVDEHAAFMAEAMQNAVQAGMAALQTQPLRHPSSLAIAPAALIPMASNCANDRDAAAFQLAMDVQRTAYLNEHAREAFLENRNSSIGRLQNVFGYSQVQLDALTLGLTKVGFSLSADFKMNPITRYVTVVVNEVDDMRVFSGHPPSGYFGIARVTYDITPRDGLVRVSVNQDASLIGGYPFSALSNIGNNNTAIELDYCLAERMAQVFNNVELSGPVSSGGVPGYTPEPGGGSSGPSICTYLLRTGTAPDLVTVGFVRLAC